MMTCALLLAACGKKAPEPPPAEPAPTPAATSAAASAPVAAPAPKPPDAGPPPYAPRPGGPSIADCEHAADHLAELVVTTVTATASAEQREYVQRLEKSERGAVIQWCLETSVPKEIECVLAAKDFHTLADCERFRREVPKDLMVRKEVTASDCEKFFDRLRQFKIGEGVDPKEIDRTKDQIVRACEEKAKPGTIACFLAAPSYAQARLCP